MKPGPPPLAAMRPNAARLLPCRPKGPNLPRLRTQRTTKVHEEYDAGEPQISEEHRVAQRIQRVTASARRTARMFLSQRTRRTQRARRRGGPCVCARHTSGPGACRGVAGFARHALVLGVHRRSRRPICPIGPICPTASCYGTSQTCRECRGSWKFGSLDAWKFGFSAQRLFCRALAARSVLEGLALWACTVISKYSGSSIAAFSNQLISQSARRSGRAPVSSWRTEKELQENKKTALRRPLWDGARGGTRTPTDLSTCTSSMRVCHFTTRAVKNGT